MAKLGGLGEAHHPLGARRRAWNDLRKQPPHQAQKGEHHPITEASRWSFRHDGVLKVPNRSCLKTPTGDSPLPSLCCLYSARDSCSLSVMESDSGEQPARACLWTSSRRVVASALSTKAHANIAFRYSKARPKSQSLL